MKQKIIKYLFSLFTTIIAHTWRIEIINKEILPIDNRFVLAFWHSNMLPAWFAFRKINAMSVVSKSNDGEILANLLHNWGFENIRGSSATNGKEVLKHIIEGLDRKAILMTPDGPKGPKNIMKIGACVAAYRSSKPLILANIKIDSAYIFKKAWDQFQYPFPFSKITINLFRIDFVSEYSNEEIEQIKVKAENFLNQTI